MAKTKLQRVNSIMNALGMSVAYNDVAESEKGLNALLEELGLNGQGQQNSGQGQQNSSQSNQNQGNSSAAGQQGGQGNSQSGQNGQGQSGDQSNGQQGSGDSQNGQNGQGQGNNSTGSTQGECCDGQTGQSQGNSASADGAGSNINPTPEQTAAMNDLQRGVSMVQAGMKASSKQGITNGINTLQQGLQDFQSAGGDAGLSQQIQQGIDKIKQGLSASSKKKIQQGIDDVNNAVGDYSQSTMDAQGQSDDTSGITSDISDNDSQSSNTTDTSQVIDDPSKKMRQETITLNGVKKTFDMICDVSSQHDLTKPTEKAEAEARVTSQAADIDTAIKQAEKTTGHKLSQQAGLGGSLASRYIDVTLGAEITDWTTILKNMLNKQRKFVYSKNSPVKSRLQSRRLPGQKKIGEFSAIEDIKICIDVSGSVTQDEIDLFLSDIASIFNHYEVDGELIYWSTRIGDAGRFHDVRGLTKVQPNTTGGTDVKCVFDYLSGKTTINGKRQVTSIKDQAVFILTDGHFDKNYEEYSRMFRGKVNWLIYDNPNFKPLFGRVYPYKKKK